MRSGADQTGGMFSTEDFSLRIERATAQAAEAGLAGLLVTPGPDLTYFTGHHPPAVTERVTMLVLQAGREPVLIVPKLERPEEATAVAVTDWADGTDPY